MTHVPLNSIPVELEWSRAGRTLPKGIGLAIGACASVVLWTVIGISLFA